MATTTMQKSVEEPNWAADNDTSSTHTTTTTTTTTTIAPDDKQQSNRPSPLNLNSPKKLAFDFGMHKTASNSSLSSMVADDEYNMFVTIPEKHLFRAILTPNGMYNYYVLNCIQEDMRKEGTQKVIDAIKQHAAKWRSKIPTPVAEIDHTCEEFEATAPVQDDRSLAAEFFRMHKALIIRFAFDCPFEDVRSSFQKLVSYLNTLGLNLV